MMSEFERETREERPVIALCYDFDKTLSPDDMQAQGYIQKVQPKGEDIIGDFWKESNGLAKDNDMDQNLAYMYTMKKKARGQLPFTKKTLAEYGAKVGLFPGVDEWFERIREYGNNRGVSIEHYIISSGLKEMIEGTTIAGEFERIYATSFYYDQDDVAVWPAQVVNYTNKTQFLFRISKGVLDVNDQSVNDSFSPDKIRVPFRNMIYIGDSDTDIPCMKLVNSRGGYSIGVFDPDKKDKTKVYKMMRDDRIGYFAPADYSEGTELDDLIKLIIDKTVYNEKLEQNHYRYKNEALNQSKKTSEEDLEKIELINDLEASRTFANTHKVIKKLSKYDNWAQWEVEALLDIGFNNSQVRYILGDKDIEAFYEKLLAQADTKDFNASMIRDILDNQD